MGEGVKGKGWNSWRYWQPSCHDEERSNQYKANAAQVTLLEPLDPEMRPFSSEHVVQVVGEQERAVLDGRAAYAKALRQERFGETEREPIATGVQRPQSGRK